MDLMCGMSNDGDSTVDIRSNGSPASDSVFSMGENRRQSYARDTTAPSVRSTENMNGIRVSELLGCCGRLQHCMIELQALLRLADSEPVLRLLKPVKLASIGRCCT